MREAAPREPPHSPGRVSSGAAGIKMTTAMPITEGALSYTNGTTKSQEQILYQSSGAIIAAIVVGVIIIFTVVLLLLKMYNRRMRAKRELEPKNAKTTVPSILGQSPNSPNAQGRHTTVTFVPVDVHVPNRRP
nr:noncompact myelin-associated protein isoform X2 [Pogona vitticeps]